MMSEQEVQQLDMDRGALCQSKSYELLHIYRKNRIWKSLQYANLFEGLSVSSEVASFD